MAYYMILYIIILLFILFGLLLLPHLLSLSLPLYRYLIPTPFKHPSLLTTTTTNDDIIFNDI